MPITWVFRSSRGSPMERSTWGSAAKLAIHSDLSSRSAASTAARSARAVQLVEQAPDEVAVDESGGSGDGEGAHLVSGASEAKHSPFVLHVGFSQG